jgi:serine/threonine protein kinase
MRLILNVLENINDKYQIENILLQSIIHISYLHHNYMFHGDIKPANIFCSSNYLSSYMATSDSGSVV